MNLRLPLIGAIVAVAAGAAIVRADHPTAPPAPFQTDTRQSRDLAAAPATRTHRTREPAEKIVVYVAGEVAHRGIYSLPASARAIDALHAAGGPTTTADLTAINLAQSLSDGDEVAVPSTTDEPTATTHRSTSHRKKHKRHKGKHKRHRHERPATSSDAVDAPSDSAPELTREPVSDTDGQGDPTALIDLNTADESELETLPGVGETLAKRIVAFRDLTGPFASPDDLLDVAGVTQAKLDELQPYIKATAGDPSPP